MDPAVVAALVTTPTAIVAATAAYAAGRAQARGAHRGPVDAVRRQHQRDAYATFHAAARAYTDATRWLVCAAQVTQGSLNPSRFEAPLQVIELIHAVPDQPVHHARALVDLEGPDELAAAAEEVASKVTAVSLQAGSVLLMAPRIRAAGDRSLFGIGMRHRAKADALKAHEELETAIASFLRIARAHLNGG